MASRDETSSGSATRTPEPSTTSSVRNAFGLMQSGGSLPQPAQQRDRCQRPTPTYNSNYNPYEPPPEDRPRTYSPYANGEPLFDDRPVIVSRLPIGYIIASATVRPKTAWV
jgi:hypothetical protein